MCANSFGCGWAVERASGTFLTGTQQAGGRSRVCEDDAGKEWINVCMRPVFFFIYFFYSFYNHLWPKHLCEMESCTTHMCSHCYSHRSGWTKRKWKCWLIPAAEFFHRLTDVGSFMRSERSTNTILPCMTYDPTLTCAGHSAAVCGYVCVCACTCREGSVVERTIQTRWSVSFSTCLRPLCPLSPPLIHFNLMALTTP